MISFIFWSGEKNVYNKKEENKSNKKIDEYAFMK